MSTTNKKKQQKVTYDLPIQQKVKYDLPIELLQLIFLCLTYEEYLIANCCCKNFQRRQAEKSFLLVPRDYMTILGAYGAYEQYKNKGKNLTTIVLGKGEHVIFDRAESEFNMEYDLRDDEENIDDELWLHTPINIVGSPEEDKKEIVVKGSFRINIDDDSDGTNIAHLKHLTIRGSKRNGVDGDSSFTLNDLIIEQCGWCGVVANGFNWPIKVTCCNVIVTGCQGSGVRAALRSSIILKGSETFISKNSYYGLEVEGLYSKIQIVSPLTRESISKDNEFRNFGGGDFLDFKTKQIEIIKEK